MLADTRSRFAKRWTKTWMDCFVSTCDNLRGAILTPSKHTLYYSETYGSALCDGRGRVPRLVMVLREAAVFADVKRLPEKIVDVKEDEVARFPAASGVQRFSRMLGNGVVEDGGEKELEERKSGDEEDYEGFDGVDPELLLTQNVMLMSEFSEDEGDAPKAEDDKTNAKDFTQK